MSRDGGEPVPLVVSFARAAELGLGVSTVGGKAKHLAMLASVLRPATAGAAPGQSPPGAKAAIGGAGGAGTDGDGARPGRGVGGAHRWRDDARAYLDGREAELAAAGGAVPHVAVPPGACVTTRAYVEHCRAAGVPVDKESADSFTGDLATAAGLAAIRASIADAPTQPALREEVEAFLGAILSGGIPGMEAAAGELSGRGWLAFAVRSSGTREDAGDKSFAGQYDTVLNVEPEADAVCAAIKQVWASQWNDHVLHYLARDSGHGAHELPHMAVVLQVMVCPTASGVLFSDSPLRSGVGRAVMEAVWGLGEALVSGAVTPSSAAADVWTGELREARNARQTERYIVAEARDDSSGETREIMPGVLSLATTSEQQDNSPLSAELVEALCRVALRITAHCGRPQDIEWCCVNRKRTDSSPASLHVFVLQTRAITSLSMARGIGNWQLSLLFPNCTTGETLTGFGNLAFVSALDPGRQLSKIARLRVALPDGTSRAGLPTDEVDGGSNSLGGAVDVQAWLVHGTATISLDDGVLGELSFGSSRRGNLLVHELDVGCSFVSLRDVAIRAQADGSSAVVALLRDRGAGITGKYVERDWGDVHIPVAVIVSAGEVATLSSLGHIWASVHGATEGSSIEGHGGAGGSVAPPAAPHAHASRSPMARLAKLDCRMFLGRTYNDLNQMNKRFDTEVTSDIAAKWCSEFDAFEIEFQETNKRLLDVLPRLATLSDAEVATELRHLVVAYGWATAHSWSQGHLSSECQDTTEAMCAPLGIELTKFLKGVSERSALQQLEDLAAAFADNDALGGVVDTYETAIDDGASSEAAVRALEEIRSNDSMKAVASGLDAFLEQHYYMAEQDEDLAASHWDEDPSFPVGVFLRLVAGIRGASDIPAAPTLARSASSIYASDRAALLATLGDDHPFWPQLEQMRGYLRGKERAHVVYVKLGYLTKRFAIEAGRRWAATGQMPPGFQPSHVLEAHWRDIVDAVDGVINIRSLGQRIANWVVYRAMWRGVNVPAGVYAGGQVKPDAEGGGSAAPVEEDDWDASAAGAVKQLTGVGVSAGSSGAVIGTARVVTNLAQSSQLRRGDVLVTEYTSPAWTPLFSIISALVMDDGGMLSHGAVVARECGVPGVILKHGTRRLRSGQRVRIDGIAGTVTVLPQDADA